MSRYIDADRVMEEIEWIGGHNLCEWHTIGVKALIDRQPIADVVEVRHGEWKDRFENKYANHYYECSVCGKSALDGTKYNQLGNPEIIEVLSDFCPHCGAKMDGERKEK